MSNPGEKSNKPSAGAVRAGRRILQIPKQVMDYRSPEDLAASVIIDAETDVNELVEVLHNELIRGNSIDCPCDFGQPEECPIEKAEKAIKKFGGPQ